jgi:uncharacterized protein (TIGR03663 family)
MQGPRGPRGRRTAVQLRMAVVDRRTPNDGGDAGSRVGAAASRHLHGWVFAAIVALAAALRVPALDLRPMHADEAVHAAKFGKLLEQGEYQYDPQEYHGPTLAYLTLIPARARGVVRHADLDEFTLRGVPAAVGVLLVAAHLLLVPVVGFRPAALSATFAAVSPAMVYYSRYYIHETLLVAFSFGALVSICRYLQTPRAAWAIAAGTAVGLMVATKETWLIAFGSMACALVLAWALGPKHQARPAPRELLRTAVHLAAAALSAITVASLFFTSFFKHPRGVVDSVVAYTTYLARAGGGGWHVHPWHYYFGLLLFTQSDGGPIWTESAILALALAGLIAVFARGRLAGGGRRPLVLLGAYAVLMAVVYATIPYKTPWCALGFLHAFILLAGVAGARLLAASLAPLLKLFVALLLGAAIAHLGWLAWAGSFRFGSDPRNPYVYAHTGPGVFEIARHVEVLARAHPDGTAMPVEVISGQNLWPLPWYLRRFPGVRWETAPVNDGVHAPVILATPDMESAIREKLFEWRPPGERELYVPIFDGPVELRPQVEVRGYAAKTLWDVAQVR